MDQGSPSTWLQDDWESAHDELMLPPERQLLPPMGEEEAEEEEQHQHQHQHQHQRQDHHEEGADAAIDLALQEDRAGVPTGGRKKGRGPGRNVTRCQNCRASKTRCCGSFPCSACFRRSWPCRPQRSRRKDAPPEERQARPLIDVVFQRANPKPQAELFKRAFLEVAREGHVDRALAVRTLRIWQNISFVAEADVTWGIGALVAKELGIASTEVEDTETLLLDRRREDRRRQALEYASRLSEVEGTLRASEAFRRADDGRVPILMTLTDGDRMLHQATNHPYERLVKGALALFDECIQRKTLQPLLIASLIGHEDRELWMRGIVQSLFTTGRYAHVAIFIKMFDPVEGDVRLTIAQADQVDVDGEHGVIYRMEPTPPSRHITDRPETCRVMKTFRRVRPLKVATERHKPTKSRVPASTADEITALKLGGRGGGSVDTSGGTSDGKDGKKTEKSGYDTEAEEDEDTADEAEEVAAEDEQEGEDEGADESSEDAGRRFPFAASSRALKALGGASSCPAALAALNSFPFLASVPGRWPQRAVDEKGGDAGEAGEGVATATTASRQTQTTAGASSQPSAAAPEAPSAPSSALPPASMGGSALSPRTVERLFAEAARAMAAAVTEQEEEDDEEAEAERALKAEGPPQQKPRRVPPLFYAAARRRREQQQREKEAKEEAERQRQLQLQLQLQQQPLLQQMQTLGSGLTGSLSMGSSSFSSASYGLSGSASSSGSLQLEAWYALPLHLPPGPHEATALIAATAASLSRGQAQAQPALAMPFTAATAPAGHGAVSKDAASHATLGLPTAAPSHEALAWTLLRLRAAHRQATGEDEAGQGNSGMAGN